MDKEQTKSIMKEYLGILAISFCFALFGALTQEEVYNGFVRFLHRSYIFMYDKVMNFL
jgi:hypothetical protein